MMSNQTVEKLFSGKRSVMVTSLPDSCTSPLRIYLKELVLYASFLNGQKTLDSFEGVDAH
jgi:hypothetical protein